MLDEVKTEEIAQAIEEKSSVDPKILEELVKAGVLYGRKKSKTHPRMQQYIFATRNEIEIIDIVQTLTLIDRAAEFLQGVAKKGGLILVAGTTPAAKAPVQALAAKFGYPYVTERWLGGTLTNFKTLNARLQHYLKLRSDRDGGKLEKYTKKERLDFDKEIARLTVLFGGLEQLVRLPDVIIIVGATAHSTAIREAKRMKIPIVAVMSSDADPDTVDYPIPANDRAASSIELILNKLSVGIEEGRKMHLAPPAPPADGTQVK